jgi:hypothetical protein
LDFDVFNALLAWLKELALVLEEFGLFCVKYLFYYNDAEFTEFFLFFDWYFS